MELLLDFFINRNVYKNLTDFSHNLSTVIFDESLPFL